MKELCPNDPVGLQCKKQMCKITEKVLVAHCADFSFV